MAAGLAAFRDMTSTPDSSSAIARRSLRFGEQHPSLPYRGDRFRRDDANVKLNMAAPCRGRRQAIRKTHRRPLRRAGTEAKSAKTVRCGRACACVALVIDGRPLGEQG